MKEEEIIYLKTSCLGKYLINFIPRKKNVRKINPIGHIKTTAYGKALDLVDKIYDSLKKQMNFENHIVNLEGNQGISFVFKKELAYELANIFYVISNLKSDNGENNTRLVIVDARYTRFKEYYVIRFICC